MNTSNSMRLLFLLAVVFMAGAEELSAKTYRLWGGQASVGLPSGVRVKPMKYPGSETQYTFTAKGSDASLTIWLSPLRGSEARWTTKKIMDEWVKGYRRLGERVLSKKLNSNRFSIEFLANGERVQTTASRTRNQLIVTWFSSTASEWNMPAHVRLRRLAASLKAR
jgi:hypothetical protein